MSPLIRAKAFATHTGVLINLVGEFSALVYYEFMKHALNYDRMDLVFEGTRSGMGEGSQYLFERDPLQKG